MSRPPRLHVDGGFCHVILRGNQREPIFFAPGDRERFVDVVAEMVQQCRMRVHAYCWMTNHVHLLMQVCDVRWATRSCALLADTRAWSRSACPRPATCSSGDIAGFSSTPTSIFLSSSGISTSIPCGPVSLQRPRSTRIPGTRPTRPGGHTIAHLRVHLAAFRPGAHGGTPSLRLA